MPVRADFQATFSASVPRKTCSRVDLPSLTECCAYSSRSTSGMQLCCVYCNQFWAGCQAVLFSNQLTCTFSWPISWYQLAIKASSLLCWALARDENTSGKPSRSCFFQCALCVGCTPSLLQPSQSLKREAASLAHAVMDLTDMQSMRFNPSSGKRPL
jgi:hypothetical protein